MKTWRMAIGAALAAMLVAGAMPSEANAQFGGLKKKLKQKLVEAVIEQATESANSITDTSSTTTVANGTAPAGASGSRVAKKGGAPQPGPTFTEYVLEMTPELLDRVEKGFAAELAMQQQIDKQVGKVLPQPQYQKCYQAVVASPEGQKVYMSYGSMINGDMSQDQLRKASQELAARFEQLVAPKCGMDPMKAAQVRQDYREQLDNAAPQAAGLTALQFSILKERMVPLCAAVDALKLVAGEARIATEMAAIYWVYSQAEVAALQPRCAKLASALHAGA